MSDMVIPDLTHRIEQIALNVADGLCGHGDLKAEMRLLVEEAAREAVAADRAQQIQATTGRAPRSLDAKVIAKWLRSHADELEARP